MRWILRFYLLPVEVQLSWESLISSVRWEDLEWMVELERLVQSSSKLRQRRWRWTVTLLFNLIHKALFCLIILSFRNQNIIKHKSPLWINLNKRNYSPSYTMECNVKFEISLWQVWKLATRNMRIFLWQRKKGPSQLRIYCMNFISEDSHQVTVYLD